MNIQSKEATRYIVKLKPGKMNRSMKIAGVQATDVERLSLGNAGDFVIVTEDPTVKGQSATALKQSLNRSSAVEYVEKFRRTAQRRTSTSIINGLSTKRPSLSNSITLGSGLKRSNNVSVRRS